MTNLWSRWKRQWRRLENAPPVLLAKRRVRQVTGTELRHFVDVRLPAERHGDWTIAAAGIGRDSVVYSFGVGTDIDLDLALIERTGVEVHAFDPTPTSRAWVKQQTLPERFRFHPFGVAGYDGEALFSPPASPEMVSHTMIERPGTASGAITGQVLRVATIMQRLGHERIDLLKMDVEGAEYAVIEDMLSCGIEPRQVLVEFHHRFRAVGRPQTARAVDLLRSAGYKIFSISPAGREYSFIRSE